MQNDITKVALGSLVFLSVAAVADAHSTEMHGKMTEDHAQMMKLHTIMPMFSIAFAQMEAALTKGDLAAVDQEAGKIKAAIPDLKKSKPHKNGKERKQYISLATKLEKMVAASADQAKNGNFTRAKASLDKAEKICATCHAKFRD